MLKEGVMWDDVHARAQRAHEIAIEGLLAPGILRRNKVETFENRTSVAFIWAWIRTIRVGIPTTKIRT